jgi:serine/threonine-protein kinase HipA
MGRKNLVQELDVYLNEKHVGTLIKQTNGAIEFRYDNQWVEDGFGISLSLPLSDKIFKGDKASFYFDNLLPDNKNILETIARKFGAESIRQFDILHAVGKDCVGALSFFDKEEEVPSFTRKMKIKALDDSEIARRIQGLAMDNPLGMDEGDFRISLAGAQEKMALLEWKGKWYEPQGQTPTSHIFKKKIGSILGGIDFSKSVDNEWICLKLAAQLGINTCSATIVNFENERILCVERFDRVWKDNFLHRIPQEDLCQALGVSPQRKYERDGGPALNDVMKLLVNSNNANEDTKTLFKLAMLNDLLHNTDGHSKNVSIYVVRSGFTLTPMYDIMSAHFIKNNNPERYKLLRSSWSVNNKFLYREIGLKDWEMESIKCGMKKEIFEEICDEFSQGIEALQKKDFQGPKDLDLEQLELILNGVKARAKTLALGTV